MTSVLCFAGLITDDDAVSADIKVDGLAEPLIGDVALRDTGPLPFCGAAGKAILHG